MKLPVNLKDLMSAATDIDAARKIPVAVAVIVDETAPEDLAGFVRRLFASDEPSCQVRAVGYAEADAIPAECDLAVLVAGFSEHTGALATALRSTGVPVLTVTSMPEIVAELAARTGNALLEGDLIGVDPGIDAAQLPATDELNQEPYPLTIERQHGLAQTMGAWIVEVFSDKRLAFALCFPFVRKPLSIEYVNATSVQNAGIGLVVVIPGADMPIMTANQAKMMLQIAAAYGQKLGFGRMKELAAVVGGAFACRTLARQVAPMLPGLGWVVKAGIGYGGTYAMGHAVIAYFENLVNGRLSPHQAMEAAQAEAARVAEVARSQETPQAAAVAVAKDVGGRVRDGAADVYAKAVPAATDAYARVVPAAKEVAEQVVPAAKDIAAQAVPAARQVAATISEATGGDPIGYGKQVVRSLLDAFGAGGRG